MHWFHRQARQAHRASLVSLALGVVLQATSPQALRAGTGSQPDAGRPASRPGWKKHVVHTGFDTATAVAADFTGDGRVDVVSNSDGKTRLFVAPDWQEVVLDARPGHNCIHSAVMDVDGDGDPDFVGARYSPGLVFWLERPARPRTAPWPLHLVDDRVDGVHGLLTADVDGDGKLDLLANSAQPKGPFPNSLVWYRVPNRPRSARAWARHVFADKDASGLSHYLGFGDVDGDGRPDAASAAKGGPTAEPGTGDWFAWWQAPADPRDVWTKHRIAHNQAGATNIHPADVNGDGRVDFIASRGHGRGVVWFEAPGWTVHTIHDTLAGPHCLVVTDLDMDGDVDAATCAKDDRLVVWFENDGRGKFTTHVIGRDQAAYDIRAVDMDRDGDLDLLIAGQQSKNVVWYENPTADSLEQALRAISRVGPQAAGSSAARQARDRLARSGTQILPRLVEALDTPNVVAANWYRSAYEAIVARELARPEPQLPLSFLREYVRNPDRPGRARRLVLELLDQVEPRFRAEVVPGLLDDPEFRQDAVAFALQRGNRARAAGQAERAGNEYRTALTHARDADQLNQAAAALKTLGVQVSLVRQMGFVTRWYLIGPFDAPGTSGFGRVFPPQESVDLAATYQGQNGTPVRWNLYQTEDRIGQLNLIQAIGSVKEAVGYAYTEVISPKRQRVELRCGADDNCTVWLNGRKVFGREQWLNGTRLDRFVVPTELNQGKNRVLVKICQGPQHKDPTVPNNWSLQLRFCDETGAAVGLRCALPSVRNDK